MVSITGKVASVLEEVDSVVTDILVVSTEVMVVSVAEVALGIVCASGWVIAAVVVAGTRPPVSGETAYGGSNSPN